MKKLANFFGETEEKEKLISSQKLLTATVMIKIGQFFRRNKVLG